jgi:HlyD family secretion protein
MKRVRETKHFKILVVVAAILGLLVVAGAARWTFGLLAGKRYVIEGTVESAEIDVAAKIPGRISQVLVAKGARVTSGEVLAVFESVEIQAKADQAAAGMAAAEDKIVQAQAAFDTAAKAYDRFQSLYDEGVIAKQKEEEIDLQYRSARAQLAMAQEGAKAAQAQLKEVGSYQDELSVKSPLDGYVSERIIEAGEVVGAGSPLFTVVRDSDYLVKIYVDESRFGYLKLSDPVTVIIPALRDKRLEGRVVRLAPAADFAVKKATNEQGSYDQRSIELEISIPADAAADLRNGMTARVELRAAR